MQWQLFAGLALTAEILAAQTVHLKTRTIETAGGQPIVRAVRKHWNEGRRHWLLQFKIPVNDDVLVELARLGATVTASVPDNAVIVAAGSEFSADGLDTVYTDEIEPDDKVSPLLGTHGNDSAFLVEFHRDVDSQTARGLLAAEGVSVVEHADLASGHYLIQGSMDDVARIKTWDEVAYLFPAPVEMASGSERFHQCAGAILNGTAVPQYVRVGHGWTPDASGHVNIGYFFSSVTAKVPEMTVKTEVERAMGEWMKVSRVQFLAASSAQQRQVVAIRFATGDHGDEYPFDGPNGILAHTFYPANPEPLAGDLHFDDAEGWHAGTNIDVYTVALHELGHALGLGHSDQPGAIMYPYYRYPSQIGIDDIAGVQSLYGAPVATVAAPTPTAAPAFVLTVQSPAAAALPVNTAAVNAVGTVANASGAVTVIWQTDHGASGNAPMSPQNAATWTAATIPTPAGSTTITFTATDAQHRTASKSVTVTRPAAAAQDTVPPVLSIANPGSVTTVQTSAASLAVSGTASDNVVVAKVTWQSPTSSGIAAGTLNWNVPSIPLLVGSNTLMFRAYDAAGNSSWRSLVVVRH